MWVKIISAGMRPEGEKVELVKVPTSSQTMLFGLVETSSFHVPTHATSNPWSAFSSPGFPKSMWGVTTSTGLVS